jgi:hypothetical protein
LFLYDCLLVVFPTSFACLEIVLKSERKATYFVSLRAKFNVALLGMPV